MTASAMVLGESHGYRLCCHGNRLLNDASGKIHRKDALGYTLHSNRSLRLIHFRFVSFRFRKLCLGLFCVCADDVSSCFVRGREKLVRYFA